MNSGIFLNAGGTSSAGSGSGSSSGAGISSLIDVAVSFGVGYLTSKGIQKENEKLLKRMAELENKEAEKLKLLISQSATEMAKTKVIFDFLTEEDAKKLEAQRKKERMLPIIGLGIVVVILGVIFYKLHNQNKNG